MGAKKVRQQAKLAGRACQALLDDVMEDENEVFEDVA